MLLRHPLSGASGTGRGMPQGVFSSGPQGIRAQPATDLSGAISLLIHCTCEPGPLADRSSDCVAANAPALLPCIIVLYAARMHNPYHQAFGFSLQAKSVQAKVRVQTMGDLTGDYSAYGVIGADLNIRDARQVPVPEPDTNCWTFWPTYACTQRSSVAVQ